MQSEEIEATAYDGNLFTEPVSLRVSSHSYHVGGGPEISSHLLLNVFEGEI